VCHLVKGQIIWSEVSSSGWTRISGPGGSNGYNSGRGINTSPPLLPQAGRPAQEQDTICSHPNSLISTFNHPNLLIFGESKERSRSTSSLKEFIFSLHLLGELVPSVSLETLGVAIVD
jgi:hypothetical protein